MAEATLKIDPSRKYEDVVAEQYEAAFGLLEELDRLAREG